MKERVLPLFIMLALLLAAGCTNDDVSADTADAPGPVRVHEDFNLTSQELDRLLAGCSPDTVARVQENPAEFLTQIKTMLHDDPSLLILVDKLHSLPSSYIPADLVELDDIAALHKNREGHTLSRLALPSLLEMSEEAKAQGLTLVCSSTYRSYVYQVKTYNYWVETMGKEKADRVSAQPGKSQHQLGLVVDFGSIDESYAATPEGMWQLENAWRFGWSLSYPDGYDDLTGYSYEPWHYRYIGKAAARMEKEYFGGIQQELLMFWNERGEQFKSAYSPSA